MDRQNRNSIGVTFTGRGRKEQHQAATPRVASLGYEREGGAEEHQKEEWEMVRQEFIETMLMPIDRARLRKYGTA